jgi:ABC-type transport system involved in multi-copper enzyme maturation permease subunit
VIEMVRRFLRQKLGSLLVVIALICLVPLAAGSIIATPGSSDNFPVTLALLLVAAGCVSRDTSSGALQMILARPIRRSAYVMGRYLGIAATIAIFLAAALAIALAVPKLLPALGLGPLDPVTALSGAGGTFLDALLIAATILFFSTFLPSYADAFAYILLMFFLAAPAVLGQLLKNASLMNLGSALRKNVAPSVPWADLLRGRDVLGEAGGRYLLALVAFLAAALIVFSRREFAYGQD